ncbi:hypothetical protein R6Q59_035623 [Mikania micrantha]|uniref:RING-type domain-containing protein n=1 Tax=Mikania micrantha TaxID=192012 RepID=A0A5N6NGD7_9ASTR|nr:hypothetical protein E3N88_23599 [Mikania micrantha]
MSINGTRTFHWQDDDLDDDDDIQIHGNTRLYILILFSIILLITIIFFIYSRCERTSSVHRSIPSSCQIRGLNAAAIDSLPITVHRSQALKETNETTSECSICLGVFEDGEKVKVLPVCCHRYHCECVDKWLLTQSSCPVCRTSVRVDSPV